MDKANFQTGRVDQVHITLVATTPYNNCKELNNKEDNANSNIGFLTQLPMVIKVSNKAHIMLRRKFTHDAYSSSLYCRSTEMVNGIAP